MKVILFVVSMLGLVLTVAPSVFVFFQVIDVETHKQLMLAGMLLWFLAAPYWMKQQSL
ncbi:MAG: hypothetical protein WD266_12155 [Balneolales bacterium]